MTGADKNPDVDITYRTHTAWLGRKFIPLFHFRCAALTINKMVGHYIRRICLSGN